MHSISKLFTAFSLVSSLIDGLRFMPNTFVDITENCVSDGKYVQYLDLSSPALYVRLDGYSSSGRQSHPKNKTFDCDIEIAPLMRKNGDKEMLEMEALSLIILELNYSSNPRPDNVRVITNSYFGKKEVIVSQEANYGSNRIWTNNPTFLLSGQLTGTGFDPIDSRQRARHTINEQHIYQPDRIFNKFDTPPSIEVKLKKWTMNSKVYLIFTSYKLLNNGDSCTDGAEYECKTTPEFKKNTGKLCMSMSLACDGLPNCGENTIPNPDEACFKIHWSSVLLSLVSYILLAITLLLCMSCFARILIQWSVRSSIHEMRSNSIRSSSRFFSLFGGSFSRRWERPPPTYDEAMKHVNPDLQHRPPDPPPYSDSFRTRFPLSRSLQALRSNSTPSGTRTPPPVYNSCEDVRMVEVNISQGEQTNRRDRRQLSPTSADHSNVPLLTSHSNVPLLTSHSNVPLLTSHSNVPLLTSAVPHVANIPTVKINQSSVPLLHTAAPHSVPLLHTADISDQERRSDNAKDQPEYGCDKSDEACSLPVGLSSCAHSVPSEIPPSLIRATQSGLLPHTTSPDSKVPDPPLGPSLPLGPPPTLGPPPPMEPQLGAIARKLSSAPPHTDYRPGYRKSLIGAPAGDKWLHRKSESQESRCERKSKSGILEEATAPEDKSYSDTLSHNTHFVRLFVCW